MNILRIEDTDRTRYVPGCEEEIVESLQWIGIEYSEGPDVGGPHAPYRQSERAGLGIYAEWIEKLLASGHAYRAFETTEELAEMREFQQVNKQPVGYYGGSWRDATPAMVEEAERAGKPSVVRLKMPRDRKLVCQDAIRGRIEWDSSDHDDPVLIKADGMPTYHFAAMVDDHIMQITHVIRGEEWISSAPKHVWLYEAFGWRPPVFVHVPVIKGKDGTKLSKRHGDTRCLDYRAAGYMPEALANFIALIGWSPGGDRELMSMEEMERAFELDGLQPSPGVFDADKLRWMNGHYLRDLSVEELVNRAETYTKAADTFEYWGQHDAEIVQPMERLRDAMAANRAYAGAALGLERERITTLAELSTAADFFFVDEPKMDEKAVEKWFGQPHVGDLFRFLRAKAASETFSPEEAEGWIREFAEANGLEKLGPAVHPVRVALTGRTVGPGLFELMSVLGGSRLRARLERAEAML